MKPNTVRLALAALIVVLIAATGCPHTDTTTTLPKPDSDRHKYMNYLLECRNADGYWTINGKVSLCLSCSQAADLMLMGGTPEEVKKYRAAAKELVGNIVMGLADPRNGCIYLKDNLDEQAAAHASALIFLVKMLDADLDYTPEEKQLTKETIVNAIRYIECHQHPTGLWYPDYIHDTLVCRHYGITILHIHALQIARSKGFAVSERCIKNGKEYIEAQLKKYE